MNPKLALCLDERLIRNAKCYSRRSGRSVSQLVADFCHLIETEEKEPDAELTPRVRALLGLLGGPARPRRTTGATWRSRAFAKGAALDDPAGLFNSGLAGSTRRAIDFHEGAEIDEEALRTLVRAAVALNKSAARG